MFRIIFVLDILNGNAVHAVRGERAKYQPVKGSVVCGSSAPLDIISTIMPTEVYIADLDYLQHLGDNFALIGQISEMTKTMVDIGPENIDDVKKCARIADTVIIGTETATFDLIAAVAERFPGRINVSIDMKNGKVLTKDRKLEMKPRELIKKLNDYDIKDIIILELSKVGTSAGIDVDFFKEVAGLSNHNILVGGGIRDMDDIHALEKIGISGALVATAVHNGKIPVELIH
ncbi:MAG: HisA/HisF-related TIM barrel protein [Candidatus Methanoperedens sp.]|nr:HisA/HisF-related TIM barrel protein [Candidatus Methanoperedens sp.]